MAGTELHRQELGLVTHRETARLRIQWDRDTHRFIFQRDDAPEVVAPYTVPDSSSAPYRDHPLPLKNE
jgi:hypothetical protein